ncbi:Rossmann fold domain-containing protein [Qipengyuania sediminis]|uniref:Rossmann fold domain-containing protein n=1 Tax=Qipengyuania sediminis TaxID=1532023 RepID=UPI001F1042AA|nr:hypothetical protein [Qipengyuania sediminis]
MRRVDIAALPDAPLAASAMVHADWLPLIESALREGADVMVSLPPADHAHREWRGALAAMLARAHTPRRCNVVAGEGAVLKAFEAYLAAAPGITGQYLEGDALGAGDTPGG